LCIQEYQPGQGADVYVYVRQNGESPADRFIEQLVKKERVLIIRWIKGFSEAGQIRNTERFNNEGDGIFAFKGFQARVLCFFLPNSSKKTIILTHGYMKKSDRLPQRQKDRALEIRSEVIRTLSNR